METMDAVQSALGPKIEPPKLVGLIAIREHSGPDVHLGEASLVFLALSRRSPRSPFLDNFRVADKPLVAPQS
jgi:hypothetical protein